MGHRYGFHEGTDGCPRPWRDLAPVNYLFGGLTHHPYHRLCDVCGAMKTPTRTIRTVAADHRE